MAKLKQNIRRNTEFQQTPGKSHLQFVDKLVSQWSKKDQTNEANKIIIHVILQ